MSYYKHYRRPYYYKNNYNKKYTNGVSVGEILAVLFGFVIFIFTSKSSEVLKDILIFIFWVTIFYFLIKGFRRIFNFKNNSTNYFDSIENIKSDIKTDKQVLLNSEKHGCKCYLENIDDEHEREVAHFLSKYLNYKDYFLFNNLIIPSENNRSTQIDHLIVSKFGIFVLESKNLGGWIFGNKEDEIWTQSFPRGNKITFQNPLRQNYAHVMAVKNLLPFVGDNLHSIIVFSNKSDFKKEAIENVVKLDGLLDYMSKFHTEVFNEKDVQLVIGKLSYLCQTSDISLSDHINNLNEYKNK